MSVLERVRENEARTAHDVVSDGHAPVRSQVKRDLVSYLGLATVASMAASEDPGRAQGELEVACRALLNMREYPGLEPSDHQQITREVLDEILGLGPIQPLLDDETVTEVMVNGCKSLFYERGGTMHQASRVFETPEQILTVVDRILAPLGRRLDESNPLVNARLANGDRVNAVIQAVAPDGPIVTIRKFASSAVTLSRLVELGSLPEWYARLLSWAVVLRQDVAVAGGTGSGKTTLLNALSCEIPHGERVITIEDSAELRFDSHPHVVRMESRDASIEGTGEVTIRDLVKNALRMRPDRIVVGEVRGEEAIDMLQAMNTGHDGSLTTLHAGTAREAILRLVLMARFGMDLPTEIIEEQVATALDLIVMSRRLPDGSRVISSLSEVRRAKAGGVELETCVSFDEQAREWHLVREPSFLAVAEAADVIDEEEVRSWRSSCS